VNLDWTEDRFQAAGAEPPSSVQDLAARLWDTQRGSHISVAAELEMSLQQQALHLAPPDLLLRLNLIERELEGVARRQPSFQRSEFEGGWSGDDDGRMSLPLKGWEWSWVARRKCRRQNWRCSGCC
jgi:hypothetical protein